MARGYETDRSPKVLHGRIPIGAPEVPAGHAVLGGEAVFTVGDGSLQTWQNFISTCASLWIN